MNTKELIWFREVCGSKSITKASQNLYVSPQGLSKTIKNLEQELGVELLIRTPNGVELTPYGEMLYDRSGILLNDYHKIQADLNLLKQQDLGYIRLSSAYGVLRLLSPDFIFNFNKEYPQVSLEYAEFPDSYVDKEIAENSSDIGFAVGPVDNSEFVKALLFSSDIRLLVHESHPLAKKDMVDFRDLEGEPMIIESHLFKIHTIIAKKCQEKGFSPNVIFNTSGFSLCHKLCRQKRGISVVVDLISADMPSSELKIIPFSEECRWEVYMICKKEFADLKYISLFRNYTQEYLKTHKLS